MFRAALAWAFVAALAAGQAPNLLQSPPLLEEDPLDIFIHMQNTSNPWEGFWWWPEDDRVWVLVCVIMFIIFIGGTGFHMATQANFRIQGQQDGEQPMEQDASQ